MIDLVELGSDLLSSNFIIPKAKKTQISFEEICQCFKLYQEAEDVNIISGFHGIVLEFITENWNKFSGEEKGAIKSELLKSISKKIPFNLTIRFVSHVSEIFNELNGMWPELLDIIFTSAPTDCTSLILNFIFNSLPSEYIEENKGKIINQVFASIQVTSIACQIRLLNTLRALAPFEFTAEMYSILWNTLYSIIITQPSLSVVLNSILIGLFGDVQSIQKTPKPEIDTNDKFLAALRLLYTFNIDQTKVLIKRVLDNPNKEVEEALGADFADTITEEQHIAIHDMINSCGETKDKYYTSVAPILPFMAENIEEVINTTIEILKSTDVQSFLTILKYSALFTFINKQPVILNTLVDVKANDDENGQNAAKVLKICLKSSAIKTRQDLKPLLAKYPSVHDNLKARFINALDGLTETTFVNPLIDFCRPILRGQASTLIKARVSMLIATLAEVDDNAPFMVQKELLAVLPSLITSHVGEEKQCGAHVLYMFTEMQPDCISRSLPAFVNNLVEFCQSEESDAKHRGAVGESVAGIIAVTQRPDDIPILLKIIEKFLSNGDRDLAISGSTMAVIAHGVFNGDLASRLFDSLASAAANVDYAPLFHSFLEAMRRLAEHAQLGQSALRLCMELLGGRARIAAAEPVSAWYNPRTPLYALISMVIRQCGESARTLAALSLRNLRVCLPAMADVAFEAVAAASEAGLLDRDEVAKECRRRCFDARSPQMLFVGAEGADPEFVSRVAEELRKDTEDGRWLSALAVAALRLDGEGLLEDEDARLDAVAAFPPPDPQMGPALAAEVVRVSRGLGEDDGEMRMMVCQALFDFLLLPRSESAAFGLSPAEAADVKNAFKSAVRSAPGFEREFRASLGKDRPKLNKLNSLLK